MPAITTFNFTNSSIIPVGTLDINGNPIGGLSGITYDAANNLYYVISDGRNIAGSPGPARFYTFNLAIALNTGNLGGVTVSGVTTIGNPPPFAPNTSDTEGIAFVNGNLYISSEGTFNGAIPTAQPFINRFALTGTQNLVLPIPAKFAATAGATGIRENRGFESLSVTPNQQFLFTATENALKQDGAAATATNGSLSRILRYNLTTGLPAGEFLYNSDAGNGISEILALDNNTLLVLERFLNPPFSGSLRLYEVSLLDATDISALDSLPATGVTPVQKTLVANLPTFGLLDNFEGMTLGPVLADGRRSLILVSDNNFGVVGTGSQFAGFAVRINSAPTLTPVAPNLTGIVEDPTTNNGDLVSTLIGNAIADVDPEALRGIAVTAVDNTNGTWEYSTDNGLNWTAFGTPSTAAVRLLAADANNRIRFVPNANYSASATITYQAWDGTRGTNGSTVDISVADRIGGITAFSTGSDTAAIAVSAVADAPTLTVTPAIGNPNTAIPLNINAALVDIDGSENLAVQIAGVPTSASLSAGTNLGNGVWQITPAQLAGLTLTSSTESNFNLTVTATSTELSNSNTVSTVATVNVTVNSGQINPNPGNPGQPSNPIQNPNDNLTIGGNAGQTQLLFTLTANDEAFVNEVGVFAIDDDQGTVNGIAPSSVSYLQAALNRGTVIFSALPNLPNGFGVTDQTRVLNFEPNTRLGFYFIQNSTTDTVLAELAAGRVSQNVFFSFTSGNTDGFDHLQVEDQGNGVLIHRWEDILGGGDGDFNDLVMSIQPTTASIRVGAGLQGESQQELIDLRNQAAGVQAQFTVNREAAFDNFVGFYKVVDVNGGIDQNGDGTADLRPGDAGYVQAAIQQRVQNLDLAVANQSTATFSAQLEAGFIYAPFLIANGRPDALVDGNAANDPAVYFPFLAANSDRVDHIRLLGDNTFGFEDLPSGGDGDFNDVIVRMTVTA